MVVTKEPEVEIAVWCTQVVTMEDWFGIKLPGYIVDYSTSLALIAGFLDLEVLEKG